MLKIHRRLKPILLLSDRNIICNMCFKQINSPIKHTYRCYIIKNVYSHKFDGIIAVLLSRDRNDVAGK